MNFIKITGVKALRPFKIQGMVLYPFILFESNSPDERLINHERIHVEQIKRDGVLRFYGRYLWEYFKGRLNKMNHDEAYRHISYEQEAYQHHHNITYQVAARR